MRRRDLEKIDTKLVPVFAKKYNPLDFLPVLKEQLQILLPHVDCFSYSKYEVHEKISEILLYCYRGETMAKFLLFEQYRMSKAVAGFEIRVNRSRLDFLLVDDCTRSFEIKSNRDNLGKLAKQINDYVSIFEFNNIVIEESHLKSALTSIPDSVGIHIAGNNEINVYREASLNEETDSESQLCALTKNELRRHFGTCDVSQIQRSRSKRELSELFKETLRCRYNTKWQFIVHHARAILPVDIQFFFNKNIPPAIVYQ